MKNFISIIVATAILWMLFLSLNSFAQNTFPSTGAAGIGTTTPNASSLLDVVSTTKGVLFPRMTKTERDAIASPAAGLLIYQTNSTPGLYYYDGTWKAVSKGANKSLSNLTDPTAVNVNLLPGTTAITDLGSSSLRWRDAYINNIKFSDGTTLSTASGGGGGIGGSGTISYLPKFTASATLGNSVIYDNAGLIGIGTTAPAGKLHITGTSDASQLIIDANATQSNTQPLIRLRNSSGTDLMHIHSDGGTSTFVGLNTGRVNNYAGGGFYNTFIGAAAGYSNTTGGYHTAIGYAALYSNTTGNFNTANGMNALYLNTTGSSNTASGYRALYNNVAGSNATAIGTNAMYYANNTATAFTNYNVAVGFEAIRGSTTASANTGNYNTALGYQTLWSNTTGTQNTANGMNVLYSNTTGNYNAASGYKALYFNTTGNYNTTNGTSSLYNNTVGNSNTSYGWGALYSNVAGNFATAIGNSAMFYSNSSVTAFDNYNVAVGYEALRGSATASANTGNNNTAIGYQTLRNNTTGDWNTATGFNSLYSNTTGDYNTAHGYKALYSNTTGVNNTANGFSALSLNTTGNNNTANGNYALYFNTTGINNTANGSGALYNNTTGYDNTAIGANTLEFNTTGAYNTAIGTYALYNNTGGANTAIGWGALDNNTTGYSNTSNGASALVLNTTGYRNTSFGANSLYNCTTAPNNTAIGYDAGTSHTTGGNCTFVGYSTEGSLGTIANSTAIGSDATVYGSNHVRIGNDAITEIGGQVGWSNLSDARLKTNVHPSTLGLDFISKLKPVTFNFTCKGQENILYTGFLAQDVDKALNDLEEDFSGLCKPESEDGYYSLRYAEFVVPLVKAVQELSAEDEGQKFENKKQQEEIENLKLENAELKARLDKIETMLQWDSGNIYSEGKTNQQSVLLIGDKSEIIPRLDQNIPNPFTKSTVINYFLPQTIKEAQINFYNERGELLKSVSLSDRGAGSIEVQQQDLASGAYSYQLAVDGKVIDAKQMVITK